MRLILLRRFAEALAAGLLAGGVLLVLAPVFLGWRPYTVLTGSMRPGVQPGDVVMDRPVKITDAHVGDVVTFSDPTRNGVLVTHRIRSIKRGPSTTDVETRGDANNSSEQWTIKTQDRVGKVVYVLPKIGNVATIIRNPLGIVVLVVVPILLIGAGVLRKIWMDDDDEDATPGGPPGPQPGADSVVSAEPSEPAVVERASRPAPDPPPTPQRVAEPVTGSGDAHPPEVGVGTACAAAAGPDR